MALTPGMRCDSSLFATTRWQMVLQAAGGGWPEATEALDELCRIYWKPLYVFLRRRGLSSHDAEDLTQDFLAYLLAKHGLSTIDRKKGKFRAFLLASLKNYLANERDRAQAQKRGGGQVPISLDSLGIEHLYHLEPVDQLTPEKMFERHWALAVLAQVRTRLHEEYAAAGKLERFQQLVSFLPGEPRHLTQAQAANAIGITEGAFKVEVHRLRRRFHGQLRAAIAETVSRPEEIDEELRYLIEVIHR